VESIPDLSDYLKALEDLDGHTEVSIPEPDVTVQNHFEQIAQCVDETQSVASDGTFVQDENCDINLQDEECDVITEDRNDDINKECEGEHCNVNNNNTYANNQNEAELSNQDNVDDGGIVNDDVIYDDISNPNEDDDVINIDDENANTQEEYIVSAINLTLQRTIKLVNGTPTEVKRTASI
jgi:hypothetical protein